MAKDFVYQWKPYIKESRRIGKGDIQPRNIYKIQVYRYSDGIVRKKLGIETSMVFVIGIHLREVHCIRLNPIMFNHFTNWTHKFAKQDLVESISDTVKSISFNKLMVEFNLNGRDFFMKHVKNTNTIYSDKLDSYRTYKLPNIIYTQEVLFDAQKIKTIYG